MRLFPLPNEDQNAFEQRSVLATRANANFGSLRTYHTGLDLDVPRVDFSYFGTPQQQHFASPLLDGDPAARLARLDYFGWQAIQNPDRWVRLDHQPIPPALPGPVIPPAIDLSSPIPLDVFGPGTQQILPMAAVGSKQGSIIGRPGEGTHSWGGQPNNWQSDNAVDIALRPGTPIRAVANAIVSSSYGYGPMGSDGGRFNGSRLHLEYGVGQVAYYTHLSKLVVEPGQRVRAGDIIGYSGSANGVDHLHFAVLKGNPLLFIQRGQRLPY